MPFPTFTITVSPLGEFQFDNGTYVDRFLCDGGDYPASSGNIISCVQKSSQNIVLTTKRSGVAVSTSSWELSSDGLQMRAVLMASQSQRPGVEKQVVFARMSGAPASFTGAWKDTKNLETRPQVLVLALRDRTLHYAFPERRQHADAALDGSDAVWHGPGVPTGVTVSFRNHGTEEFVTSRKYRGQITNQGFMRIDDDGRTLVEVFWNPDRPDQRAVLFYTKQ